MYARHLMPYDLALLLLLWALWLGLKPDAGTWRSYISGFIAGLAIAVPVLIKYTLQGARAVEATFGFDYLRWIGSGLIVACIGGLGSLAFGLPFLTSGHVDLDLPLIGKLPLASALVFDTGVYMVVFAGALLILSTMGTVKHRQRDDEDKGVA